MKFNLLNTIYNTHISWPVAVRHKDFPQLSGFALGFGCAASRLFVNGMSQLYLR